jgi:TrmH family RNA methyltransferase
MPVRIVQSKQNSRLKELRRALAHPGRGSQGLAGIEGPHLVEEALRARLRVKTVFLRLDNKEIVGVRDADKHGIEEVLFVLPDVFDSIVQTEAPQPVAALVEMPTWTWEQVLGSQKRPPLVIVLAALQDPGNLGTILRSAEAFGASGIVCLPGTVNPWNPKALRASAGSLFRMPLVAATAEECFSHLRNAEARILNTAIEGAKPAHETDLAGPAAILIGNEGAGVPGELAAHADAAVTIATPGPVESLNAAVAASILLYEASRQRSSRHPNAVKGTPR